jgi:hypothetical protein
VLAILPVHGTGLFGLISPRDGADEGSKQTLMEIWATDRKLIIVLDDRDLETTSGLVFECNRPTLVLQSLH